MLYLFTGQIRNGKTVSAVCSIEDLYKLGYTIYSNIKLTFPYIKLTRKMILEWEKNDLDLPPKTAFVIDEMHAWFDSRNSQTSNNRVFSYFITQLGKFGGNKQTGLTVIGTTQFFTQLDIRGRRIVDKIIDCKKIEEIDNEYIIVRRTWKKNFNLNLKIIKKEIVKFTKEDFALYETQEKVKSTPEIELTT
jgi:hypothetical protein